VITFCSFFSFTRITTNAFTILTLKMQLCSSLYLLYLALIMVHLERTI